MTLSQEGVISFPSVSESATVFLNHPMGALLGDPNFPSSTRLPISSSVSQAWLDPITQPLAREPVAQPSHVHVARPLLFVLMNLVERG